MKWRGVAGLDWSDGGSYERPAQVPENGAKEESLLYGPRGEVILKRIPRPMGFRPRSEGVKP
jgi:hypothetical protein